MNWKVRIKNPVFWVTLIPAVLLVIQTVLVPFGITWDPTPLAEQLVAIVNAVFGVLVILGVGGRHDHRRHRRQRPGDDLRGPEGR